MSSDLQMSLYTGLLIYTRTSPYTETFAFYPLNPVNAAGRCFQVFFIKRNM